MSELATLEVKDLHKYFGEHEVLKGIDLTAYKGDVISILGSSGSGKKYAAPVYQPVGNAQCRRCVGER